MNYLSKITHLLAMSSYIVLIFQKTDDYHLCHLLSNSKPNFTIMLKGPTLDQNSWEGKVIYD